MEKLRQADDARSARFERPLEFPLRRVGVNRDGVEASALPQATADAAAGSRPFRVQPWREVFSRGQRSDAAVGRSLKLTIVGLDGAWVRVFTVGTWSTGSRVGKCMREIAGSECAHPFLRG